MIAVFNLRKRPHRLYKTETYRRMSSVYPHNSGLFRGQNIATIKICGNWPLLWFLFRIDFEQVRVSPMSRLSKKSQLLNEARVIFSFGLS